MQPKGECRTLEPGLVVARRFLLSAFASLGLSLVAAWLIGSEYRAFGLTRAKGTQAFSMIASGELPYSRSIAGQRGELVACEAALFGSVAVAQPAPAIRDVAFACLARADVALGATKSWALAHLVRSGALLRLGRGAEAGLPLIRSQQAGPAEGWIAERRFVVALDATDLPPDARQHIFATDIVLLAGSVPGRVLLADRYLRRPDLGDVIISWVETAPITDQRRFLAAVADARGTR